MTDKPTPTDAELKAMWQIHAADIGGIFCYARAVLAKWGQPAKPDPAYSAACHLATALFKKHFAHLPDFASGQAVWSLCDSTAGVILQIDNMVSCLVQPPTTSPQTAQPAPQPVEREPLSDDEVDSLCKVGPVYAPDGKVTLTTPQYRYELESAQRYGLRKGERAHGIKKRAPHVE